MNFDWFFPTLIKLGFVADKRNPKTQNKVSSLT